MDTGTIIVVICLALLAAKLGYVAWLEWSGQAYDDDDENGDVSGWG